MDNATVISATMPTITPAQIILVVDNSGSMSNIKSDAEGGINNFITEQRNIPSPTNLLLVEFEGQVTVHSNKNINDVESYVLKPNGFTALYDAIGKAITSYTHVADEKVIVVIVTDGQENASHEFTKSSVKALVDLRTEQGWEFIFLGASMDTFSESASLGIASGSTAKYDLNDAQGYSKAFTASTAYTTSLRSMSKSAAEEVFATTKANLGIE